MTQQKSLKLKFSKQTNLCKEAKIGEFSAFMASKMEKCTLLKCQMANFLFNKASTLFTDSFTKSVLTVGSVKVLSCLFEIFSIDFFS